MRLIDAEALTKRMKLEEAYAEYLGVNYEDAVVMIESAPTIEAKPVVHAHWENIIIGFFSCSHCGNSTRNNMSDHKEQKALFNDKFGMTAFAYCPYCGAQMDEKESD